MGSLTNNKDDSSRQLPTIKLDTTLAELYKRACPRHANKRITQVLCGVNSGLDLSPDFPRNTKYLYQDSPFNTTPIQEMTRDNIELQRTLAMKYLQLVPQRDAFIAGDTTVVLFNVDQTPEQKAHDRREAEATLSVIAEDQRPKLLFCPGPAKIPTKEHGIDLVACKLALDGLDNYNLTVDLETHWFLNTKAALAMSRLPTPRAEIIQVVGLGPASNACCKVCTDGGSDILFVPTTCTGRRATWLAEQTQRILDAVEKREVPFVLKNQQSFGGAGTYVVTSEEQKAKLISDLAGKPDDENDSGILGKLLSQVTEANSHLHPGSIIISDMVRDPIGDYGLTFFVSDTRSAAHAEAGSGGAKHDGDPIFLAVSEQMIDENSAWIGSTINYAHQEELRAKFEPLMRRTAAYLAEQGYYGPVGADVLETAEPGVTVSASGEETTMYIVDLNVRTSGSMCLPLLRGHFTSRGLNCASSFSVAVQGGREEFADRWWREFEAGRMCILSWYQDPRSGESLADVAVGGVDEKEVRKKMDKVLKADTTEEVTF